MLMGAAVIFGAGTDTVIAVATGSVPSGHVSGGITYVMPSEQHMPPGGMHANGPGQAGIQLGLSHSCLPSRTDDLFNTLMGSLGKAMAGIAVTMSQNGA